MVAVATAAGTERVFGELNIVTTSPLIIMPGPSCTMLMAPCIVPTRVADSFPCAPIVSPLGTPAEL